MTAPGNRPDWAHRATDGLDWDQVDPAIAPPEPLPPGPRPPLRRRPRIWLAVAVAAAGGVVGGAVAGALVALWIAGDDSPEPAAPGAAPPIVMAEVSTALAEAAALARESVVKIESTRQTENGLERDVGSGVIIDGEGHIVTNAHVVIGTETLNVVLPDGGSRAAILVGHDYPFTDVAVLQIGPSAFPALAVGDPHALGLGEAVIAIGNPLAEFDGAVTAGVVSGLDRHQVLDGVRQDGLIQTDAAVNSGNSGGALVNLAGEFVGIPTIVVRRNSVAGVPTEGIALALPSDRVMEIARGIIAAGGPLTRPTLATEHEEYGPSTAFRGQRPDAEAGAIVTAVAAGGPAAQAGIRPGDVITEVGDLVVDDGHPLWNALLAFTPGQEVGVVLNRGGQIIHLQVRLGART